MAFFTMLVPHALSATNLPEDDLSKNFKNAQNLICIPEKTSLMFKDKSGFKVSETDRFEFKFIFTKENGKLLVKLHPHQVVTFSKCLLGEDQASCYSSYKDAYTGVFIYHKLRDSKITFTAFLSMENLNEDDQVATTVKGYCTSFEK